MKDKFSVQAIEAMMKLILIYIIFYIFELLNILAKFEFTTTKAVIEAWCKNVALGDAKPIMT